MVKPRGKVEHYNESRKGYVKIGEPQVEIAAWSRDDDGKLPPEQVHFIIHWPEQLSNLPPMMIRFKSPDTLGFFIEELTKYRRIVWPDSERVAGEK